MALTVPGRARVLLRQAAVAMVLAGALLLMHGGIGAADACTGMPGMASGPTTSASAMPADAPSGHADRGAAPGRSGHHDPRAPTGKHGAELCLSTAACGPDRACDGATGLRAALPVSFTAAPDAAGGVRSAAGREPPAPDPVTVLCVSRR